MDMSEGLPLELNREKLKPVSSEIRNQVLGVQNRADVIREELEKVTATLETDELAKLGDYLEAARVIYNQLQELSEELVHEEARWSDPVMDSMVSDVVKRFNHLDSLYKAVVDELGRESTDDTSVDQKNENVSNSVTPRVDISEPRMSPEEKVRPVKGVRSLSDLRNLPGLDAVIKTETEVENEGSSIAIPADANNEAQDDDRLNEFFVRAGFQDDFPKDATKEEVSADVPATTTDGITHGEKPFTLSNSEQTTSLTNEESPKQPERRLEFNQELYERWQRNDPTLLPNRSEGWEDRLDVIEEDVKKLLEAAGYGEGEIRGFDSEIVQPWRSKVEALRNIKKGKKKYGALGGELLSAVSARLAGHEPDPMMFTGSESRTDLESSYGTEVEEEGSVEGDEDMVSFDTLPEIERSLEQAQFEFMRLREALVNEPAATAYIAQGERLMEQLANLQETDDAVKLTRKQKYLKTLLVLNERLHTYLPEEVEPASYLDLVETDPVNGGGGGGGGQARVSSESAPVNTERELSYAEARSERRVAKAAFTEARDEYYTALHTYYRNLGVRARELVGMTVTLPPELEALKAKHDETQRVYAEALDGALVARAQVAGNREYASLAADSTKAAFAERFVFRSVEETEAAKREVGSPSEFVSRAKALATFIREHKTLVRIGALGMHMAVGAVSGGVANAAFVGARVASGMVAGSLGGLAGANVGRRVFEEDVVAAQAKTTETKEKATNEFSFTNLNRAAEDYQAAYRTQKRTETKHKVATVTGAIVGGMAAGRAASEVVSDIYEVLTSTPIITTSAEVTRYAPNGEALPTLKIEGITLRGGNVGALTESELPDAQMPQIFKEIRLHLADLLEAHPNMSQGKLEDEVFTRLEAKYGSEEWWQKADIKSFDIGSISEKISPAVAPASPEELTLAEPVPLEPIVAKPPSAETAMLVEHSVQQGDTLTKIVREEFADRLKDLSPAERDRALAELFEKARTDATLRESIGLRSGDIDRIYVGEQLELSKLGDELKSIIESEPTRPRTGALPVAMEGGVEDVPIRFGGSPITETTIDVGGVTESTPADFDTTEVVRSSESAAAASGPLVYNPPRPELGYVISGNYFRSPQYLDFLAEQGVSVERVEDATSKFALEFEGKTYSWLNEVLQKFDSPYSELKTMSLKELDTIREQAGGSEERLRVLLTEQAARETAKQGMVVSDIPKTFNLPTMRAWESLIDNIRRTEGFAYNENTTIEDLVKRHVAEQMIKQDYDVRFKASMKQ